ncbi:unnamed protein product [Ectocarpus sp. 12 AP-2014]
MGNVQSMMVPGAASGVLIMVQTVSAASTSGWRGWNVGSTSAWEWRISTLGRTLFLVLVVRLLKKMSIDVAAIRASVEANQLRAQESGGRASAHPPGGPQNARSISAAGNGMREAGVQVPAPAGPQNAGWFTWLTNPFSAAFNEIGEAALYDMAEAPDGPPNARWFTPWTIDPFGVVSDDVEAAPHNTEQTQ